MSPIQFCVKTLQKAILLILVCPVTVIGLMHFDTAKMPDNSELIPMKVSNVFMGNDGDRSPHSDDHDLMPVQMEVDLFCRGNPIHLNLHFHDNRNHNTQGIPSVTSTMEEIPVFTKSDNSNNITLDNFPRLYTRSCRTFRDSKNQAAFLVISDPYFSSFKFFGSFLMGNTQYFVQPYIGAGNNDTTRLHVSTETPKIEFSDDGEVALLPDAGSPGSNDLSKITNHQNPYQSDVKNSQLSFEQKEEILREIMAKRSKLPTHKPENDNVTKDTNKRQTDDDILPGLSKQPSDDINITVAPTEGVTNEKQHDSTFKPEQDVPDVSNNPILKKLSRRFGGTISTRKRRESDVEHNSLYREKRQALFTYTVEVILVCDFLCYKRFQQIYGLSDEVQTKNTIALYFSYIREQYQITFSSILDLYPRLRTSVEITVPALFIATTPDEKIIGDYILEEGTNFVDSASSLFEFAVWVQDSMKVSLKADHYALVTGYNIFGTRNRRGVVGQVTRIPSVCEIDRVSINEFIPGVVGLILSHELGHSLGAIHDGLTDGVCTDEEQFIMTTVLGGNVPIPNEGNLYKLSFCSATLIAFTLPLRSCVRRDDFDSSTLPDEVPLLGQQFPFESQCSFAGNSTVCRRLVVETEGTWDRACSSLQCERNDLCFAIPSLQYASCGNKRWCERGRCVDNPNAPEKPVDCPAGDSPTVVCDVSKCSTYDEFFRFVQCCDTCQPIRTERFVIFERSS